MAEGTQQAGEFDWFLEDIGALGATPPEPPRGLPGVPEATGVGAPEPAMLGAPEPAGEFDWFLEDIGVEVPPGARAQKPTVPKEVRDAARSADLSDQDALSLLPDKLAYEVPPELLEDVDWQRDPEGFRREHRAMVANFNRARTTEEKAKIMVDWSYKWNKSLTKSAEEEAGVWSRVGHAFLEAPGVMPTLTGLANVVMWVDSWSGRPIRAATKSLWESRKRDLLGGGAFDWDEMSADRERSYKESDASFEDGENAAKSAMKYIASLGGWLPGNAYQLASGGEFTNKMFHDLIDENVDKLFDAGADAIQWGTWSGLGAVAELWPGGEGYEEWKSSRDKKIEEGSSFGHGTLGFLGLVLTDPITFMKFPQAIKLFNIALTDSGLSVVDDAILQYTAKHQRQLTIQAEKQAGKGAESLYVKATGEVDHDAIRAAAMEQAHLELNIPMVDLADTGFRKDVVPHGWSSFESLKKLREGIEKTDVSYWKTQFPEMTEEAAEKAAGEFVLDKNVMGLVDDILEKNKFVKDVATNATPTMKLEEAWAALVRESHDRKELFDIHIRPTGEINPETGKEVIEHFVDWVDPRKVLNSRGDMHLNLPGELRKKVPLISRKGTSRLSQGIEDVVVGTAGAAGRALRKDAPQTAAQLAKAEKGSKAAAFARTRIISSADNRRVRWGKAIINRYPFLEAPRMELGSIAFLQKAQPYVNRIGDGYHKMPSVMHGAKWRQFERLELRDQAQRTLDRQLLANHIDRIDGIVAATGERGMHVRQLAMHYKELGQHIPVTEAQLETLAWKVRLEKDIDDLSNGIIDSLPAETKARYAEAAKASGDEAMARDQIRTLEQIMASGKAERKADLKSFKESLSLTTAILKRTMVDDYRVKAEMQIVGEILPHVQKLKQLRGVKAELEDLFKRRDMSEASSLEQLTEQLKIIKGIQDKGLDAARTEAAPLAKTEAEFLQGLRVSGFVPEGTAGDWAASKSAIGERVRSSLEASGVEEFGQQADSVMSVLSARASTWTIWNKLPDEYADAWFVKYSKDIEEELGLFAKRAEATGVWHRQIGWLDEEEMLMVGFETGPKLSALWGTEEKLRSALFDAIKGDRIADIEYMLRSPGMVRRLDDLIVVAEIHGGRSSESIAARYLYWRSEYLRAHFEGLGAEGRVMAAKKELLSLYNDNYEMFGGRVFEATPLAGAAKKATSEPAAKRIADTLETVEGRRVTAELKAAANTPEMGTAYAKLVASRANAWGIANDKPAEEFLARLFVRTAEDKDEVLGRLITEIDPDLKPREIIAGRRPATTGDAAGEAAARGEPEMPWYWSSASPKAIEDFNDLVAGRYRPDKVQKVRGTNYIATYEERSAAFHAARKSSEEYQNARRAWSELNNADHKTLHKLEDVAGITAHNEGIRYGEKIRLYVRKIDGKDEIVAARVKDGFKEATAMRSEEWRIFGSKFRDLSKKNSKWRKLEEQFWKQRAESDAAYKTRRDLWEGIWNTYFPADWRAEGLDTTTAMIVFGENEKALIFQFEGLRGAGDLGHELGHFFRRDLPKELDDRAAAWAERVSGHGKVDDKWSIGMDEAFAEAFELYLKTGKAPAGSGMDGIFRKFKEWIKQIMSPLISSGKLKNVDDEIRQIFDEMFDAGSIKGGTGSAAARAADDGRQIISSFQSSTFQDMIKGVGRVFAKDLPKKDYDIASDWIQREIGNAGFMKDGKTWSEAGQSMWAQGFANWTKSGKVTNQSLREVFAKFKEWIFKIYRAVSGKKEYKFKISPEVEAVFDRLLSKEAGYATHPLSREFEFAYENYVKALGTGEAILGKAILNEVLIAMMEVGKYAPHQIRKVNKMLLSTDSAERAQARNFIRGEVSDKLAGRFQAPRAGFEIKAPKFKNTAAGFKGALADSLQEYAALTAEEAWSVINTSYDLVKSEAITSRHGRFTYAKGKNFYQDMVVGLAKKYVDMHPSKAPGYARESYKVPNRTVTDIVKNFSRVEFNWIRRKHKVKEVPPKGYPETAGEVIPGGRLAERYVPKGTGAGGIEFPSEALRQEYYWATKQLLNAAGIRDADELALRVLAKPGEIRHTDIIELDSAVVRALDELETPEVARRINVETKLKDSDAAIEQYDSAIKQAQEDKRAWKSGERMAEEHAAAEAKVAAEAVELEVASMPRMTKIESGVYGSVGLGTGARKGQMFKVSKDEAGAWTWTQYYPNDVLPEGWPKIPSDEQVAIAGYGAGEPQLYKTMTAALEDMEAHIATGEASAAASKYASGATGAPKPAAAAEAPDLVKRGSVYYPKDARGMIDDSVAPIHKVSVGGEDRYVTWVGVEGIGKNWLEYGEDLPDLGTGVYSKKDMVAKLEKEAPKAAAAAEALSEYELKAIERGWNPGEWTDNAAKEAFKTHSFLSTLVGPEGISRQKISAAKKEITKRLAAKGYKYEDMLDPSGWIEQQRAADMLGIGTEWQWMQGGDWIAPEWMSAMEKKANILGVDLPSRGSKGTKAYAESIIKAVDEAKPAAGFDKAKAAAAMADLPEDIYEQTRVYKQVMNIPVRNITKEIADFTPETTLAKLEQFIIERLKRDHAIPENKAKELVADVVPSGETRQVFKGRKNTKYHKDLANDLKAIDADTGKSIADEWVDGIVDSISGSYRGALRFDRVAVEKYLLKTGDLPDAMKRGAEEADAIIRDSQKRLESITARREDLVRQLDALNVTHSDSYLSEAAEVSARRETITAEAVEKAKAQTKWIDDEIASLEATISGARTEAKRGADELSKIALEEELSPLARYEVGPTGRKRRILGEGEEEITGAVERIHKKIAEGLTRGQPRRVTDAADLGGIVPKKLTDKMEEKIKAIPGAKEELLDVARKLNWDLTDTGKIWEQIVNLRSRARSYGDLAKTKMEAAEAALHNYEKIRAFERMPEAEKTIITNLMRDPGKYRIPPGASPKARRMAEELGMHSSGKDVFIHLVGKDIKKKYKIETASDVARRKVRAGDYFTDEEIEQALEVAQVMEEFFEEKLKKLQAHGRLTKFRDKKVGNQIDKIQRKIGGAEDMVGDETIETLTAKLEELRLKEYRPWTKDDFLRRVNVASYVPHMMRLAARRKVEGLRGRLLPSNYQIGFEKMRTRASVLDDINQMARDELAEDMLYHDATSMSAGGPQFDSVFAGKSEEELLAIFDSAQSLKLKENFSPEEWAKLIKSKTKQAELDGVYEFFETDYNVLIKRYSQSVDKAIADQVFIEDMLDMFPLGKEMGLHQKFRDNPDLAKEFGYVKLGKKDHVEAIGRMKLPRELTPDIENWVNQQILDGADIPEIMGGLRRKGVNVSRDVVELYKALPDVFVPEPVMEYLKWMRSPAEYKPGWEPLLGLVDGIHAVAKTMATVSSLAHVGMNFTGNYVAIAQKIGADLFNPRHHYNMWMMMASDTWPQLEKYVLSVGPVKKTIGQLKRDMAAHGIDESPRTLAFLEEALGAADTSAGVAPLKHMLLGSGLGAGGGWMAGSALAGPLGGAAGGFLGSWVGALGGEMVGKSWRTLLDPATGKASSKILAGKTLDLRKGVADVSNTEIGKFVDSIKEFSVTTGKTKAAVQQIGEKAVGFGTAGVVASTIGGPAGAVATAIAGLSFPSYIKMMSALNQSVEIQARRLLGLAELSRGKSLDEAAFAVQDALRNYSHLTPIEKRILRRVFFFYTWDAGNVRFQVNQLVKYPRQAAIFNQFMAGMYNGQFTEAEVQALPEYLRWKAIVRLGGAKIYSFSGLPQQAAIELSRGFGTHGGVPIGILSRGRPDAVLLAEIVWGKKSLYFNKGWGKLNNVRQLKNAPPLLKWIVGYPSKPMPINVYKDGRVVGKRLDYRANNPEAMYIMSRLPGWRVMMEYNKVVQDTFISRALDRGDPSAKATTEERMLAYSVGLKPYFVDFDSQREYMAYQLIEALTEKWEEINRNFSSKRQFLNKTFDGPSGRLMYPGDVIDDDEAE